jgi:hypothetical protein
VEFTLQFGGCSEWVWIDCFRSPLADISIYDRLRKRFRTCLVSPELEGHPRSFISLYSALVKHAIPDAVCTDFPEAWTALTAAGPASVDRVVA